MLRLITIMIDLEIHVVDSITEKSALKVCRHHGGTGLGKIESNDRIPELLVDDGLWSLRVIVSPRLTASLCEWRKQPKGQG